MGSEKYKMIRFSHFLKIKFLRNGQKVAKNGQKLFCSDCSKWDFLGSVVFHSARKFQNFDPNKSTIWSDGYLQYQRAMKYHEIKSEFAAAEVLLPTKIVGALPLFRRSCLGSIFLKFSQPFLTLIIIFHLLSIQYQYCCCPSSGYAVEP